MEAKMANINSVTTMPFACENGGCNKRFRPLVPKLTLSPSSAAPMANAVWSTQQSHDQYNQLQQAFCSATSGNSVSMSAAACLLEPKINRLDGKADENANQRSQIDRLIKGDQQNMKEEQAESCAVQSQPAASGTRWNPTPDQIRILEMFYKGGMRTPNAEQIEHITAQLRQYGKIEGKNVFYWFQNHKARERQKQKRNSSMQQVAATAAAKKTPTTLTVDNPNELHNPNSNGTYSLYNLPFAAMSEDSRLMFASSSLLAMPCSKGLAASLAQAGVDVRTPASTGAKRDGLEVLKRNSHGPPQVQMNDEGSPSKNSMIWDSINSSGEGIITNLALSQQAAADMPVNVNSCKRKNRMWQIMSPNEELGLHTESSSESICLQTSSDPINPSEYIDEEDHRKLQTLQLFPLRPEGSLKSKGTETNTDNSMLSLHVNPSSICPYPFREFNKSAESSTQKGSVFEEQKYSKAADFFPNISSADYSFLNSLT